MAYVPESNEIGKIKVRINRSMYIFKYYKNGKPITMTEYRNLIKPVVEPYDKKLNELYNEIERIKSERSDAIHKFNQENNIEVKKTM